MGYTAVRPVLSLATKIIKPKPHIITINKILNKNISSEFNINISVPLLITPGCITSQFFSVDNHRITFFGIYISQIIEHIEEVGISHRIVGPCVISVSYHFNQRSAKPMYKTRIVFC